MSERQAKSVHCAFLLTTKSFYLQEDESILGKQSVGTGTSMYNGEYVGENE